VQETPVGALHVHAVHARSSVSPPLAAVRTVYGAGHAASPTLAMQGRGKNPSGGSAAHTSSSRQPSCKKEGAMQPRTDSGKLAGPRLGAPPLAAHDAAETVAAVPIEDVEATSTHGSVIADSDGVPAHEPAP